MKIQTALVALITATVLTGCGAAEPDKTDKTDKTDSLTSVVEEAGEDPEQGVDGGLKTLARETLRKQQPDLVAGRSDTEIDQLAEATCSAFDAGATPEEMVMAAIEDDLASETGSVMMMAAMVYCPEYKNLVDEFSEKY